jgi:hypothetical protein
MVTIDGAMTLSITAFSLTTFGVTIKHETQHNIAILLIVSFILSVAFFNVMLNAVMPSVFILRGMVLIVAATLTGQC